jgi:Xaa-Pro aminopeptidase
MLGLDVHDCSKAREAEYLGGPLAAGQVLTVEPGLYFQANDELLPPELRGIGVRIEDDVLITADGYKLLSGALPRDPDEIEAWCAAGGNTAAGRMG